MNRQRFFVGISFIFIFFLPGKTVVSQSPAEDLWGNKVKLDQSIASKLPTVIVPFSSSNCGYCLIDGYYTEKNYIGNNSKFGGASYHMELFNPQLDIYAFYKHFRWTDTILTSPTSLHRYHDDGFPTLLAFREGKQLLKQFFNFAKFDTLKTLLWDTSIHLIPTGAMHLANAFINENENFASVLVYPAGAEIPASVVEFAKKWKLLCKHLDELSPEDLNRHLNLTGNFTFEEISKFLPDGGIPVLFKENRIMVGGYSFHYDSTGISACFPSPFNREKFMVIDLINDQARLLRRSNYLDYIVFTGNTKENFSGLLYGQFDKSEDYLWKFDEELSFSDKDKHSYCEKVCVVPSRKKLKVFPGTNVPYDHSKREDGEEWILGKGSCRFPDIAPDSGNHAWVTWEENGNILLAELSPDGRVSSWFAENNESDSYNPRVVVSGGDVWVFYLNDRVGYYRVYARKFNGIVFSDEVLISREGPFDAVLPDAVSRDDGEITVAWTVWQANYRFIYYRKILAGVPGEILRVKEVPPIYTGNYTNAWYPSLCYSGEGKVWGTWVQHYPANFGICGGELGDSSVTITQPAKKMEDWECGGYPSIFSTPGGTLVTAWESSAWDFYYDSTPQKIKVSKYDKTQGKWSAGTVISVAGQSVLNQTPSGVCDPSGNCRVVWSGRAEGETEPWKLFLAREVKGRWTAPVVLSGITDNDRHPEMVADKAGYLWISCHTGVGDRMKVKVIRMKQE